MGGAGGSSGGVLEPLMITGLLTGPLVGDFTAGF
jgi:hypothetical protein